jgi:aspartate carbamoyltransferase catalytic subunit
LEAQGLPFIHPLWPNRHVLGLEGLSRPDLEQVLELTATLGRTAAAYLPRLDGRVVATLFYEPSTRTRVSFELAARRLGAEVLTVGVGESSVVKGESLLDTAATLEAIGTDVIVLRHPDAGAPETVAPHLSTARLVNAGDGWREHPTQGLLDLYTIRSRLGGLDGLRVVIVGDIVHSRVARSNLWGLTTMGAEVVLCGPPVLVPEQNNRWNARVEIDLDAALEDAHVVMALRLQKERHGSPVDAKEYVGAYQITPERLRRARPGALLMHPGPVNVGVELSPSAAYGPQSVIREQVQNGVLVRMAVVLLLVGGGVR